MQPYEIWPNPFSRLLLARDRVIALRAMVRVTMQLIMEKIYADEADDRERTNRCDMSGEKG